MNKSIFVIGLPLALISSLGFSTSVPPDERKEPHPVGPDRRPGPADHERIAAAQAKRERKAARLAALASKPPTEDEG